MQSPPIGQTASKTGRNLENGGANPAKAGMPRKVGASRVRASTKAGANEGTGETKVGKRAKGTKAANPEKVDAMPKKADASLEIDSMKAGANSTEIKGETMTKAGANAGTGDTKAGANPTETNGVTMTKVGENLESTDETNGVTIAKASATRCRATAVGLYLICRSSQSRVGACTAVTALTTVSKIMEKSAAADSYAWVRADGRTQLATENLVPGNRAYKERLVRKDGIEYRTWDPFRSKLAAAVMNGLDAIPFGPGSSILYLGASTGTTVSHVSDIVGSGGMVFAVEHASRVARELLERVARHRSNVLPIISDARRPDAYSGMYGKVEAIYSDVAQPDQTQIAITNCTKFLEPGGVLMMVVKARSIDVTHSPQEIARREVRKLEQSFAIIQHIDLHPYDLDHAMVVARFRPQA